MGSKKFIMYTQQNLLHILVNIIIDSTDQTAITKYAGSSFRKTADLAKFKSIIISFFMLSKQCIVKWAQWIPNQQFKFYQTYLDLKKKGIKFEKQFKYFRNQNQTNFRNNCKKNGLTLDLLANVDRKNNKSQIKMKQSKNNISSKQAPIKDVNRNKNDINDAKSTLKQKQNQSLLAVPQLKKQPVLSKFKLSSRVKPKSKNNYILQCHKIIQNYDQKLLKAEMIDKDLDDLNNKTNDLLGQYMGLPNLNQNQMQIQIQSIFVNIKHITDDFNKYKQIKKENQTNQEIQKSPLLTIGVNSMKKTQTLPSFNQNQSKLTNANKTKQQKEFKAPASKPEFQNKNVKNSKVNVLIFDQQQEKKQIEQQNLTNKTNNNRKQIQSTSIQKKQKKTAQNTQKILLQSNKKQQIKISSNKTQIHKSSTTNNNIKQQKEVSNNISQMRDSKQKQTQIKQRQNPFKSMNLKLKQNPKKQEEKVLILKQNNKKTKNDQQKTYQKQIFDSKLSYDNGQSSRVNFSQDSQQSNDQCQRYKLPSIKQQKQQAQSSRQKNNTSHEINKTHSQSPSIYKGSIQQKNLVSQYKHINNHSPTQSQVPKQLITKYQKQINQLNNKLQNKNQIQKRMQIRLFQLNQLKKIQQEQLVKIKEQNNKIIKQFSNTVDAKEYQNVKKQFNDMKFKNKIMQEQMQKLLKQINNLKEEQKKNKQSSKKYDEKSNVYSQNYKILDLLNDSGLDKSFDKIHRNIDKRHNNLGYFDQSENENKSFKKQINPKIIITSPFALSQNAQKKPNFNIEKLHEDYQINRTHFSQLKNYINENNLNLLKKSLFNTSQLFYTSDLFSLISKLSIFEQQRMTLKLQLSIQLKSMNLNKIMNSKPNIKLYNMEEIQIWKKKLIGQQNLYHQELIIKVNKYPFNFVKMQIQLSENKKQQILLPFFYFNFLYKLIFIQQDFNEIFQKHKQYLIKSKVFTLNPKIVKDFKNISQYQLGFKLSNDKEIIFKLQQITRTSKNTFWGQISNLSKNKCFIKILSQPFNEQTSQKAQEIIQNLLFILSC